LQGEAGCGFSAELDPPVMTTAIAIIICICTFFAFSYGENLVDNL
jgi:hypothetical protein